MTDDIPSEPLLRGVRVIDMCDQKLETTGRVLGDLGADVIRVERPTGAASRSRPPLKDSVSIYFGVRNANKRGVTLDLETIEGQRRLWQLLSSADIWIESTQPGTLGRYGLEPETVLGRLPSLVILSTTDFGQTGPYRDFVGSDPVLLALGTQLSRSGKPGREPLIPAGAMAYETSAVQAAWAAVLAYYQRMDTGVGDWLDFSILESTIMLMDPAFGTIGTATAATQSGDDLSARYSDRGSRGRPAANPYPIFPCADGNVRILVLAPHQWHAMRAWLGEPDVFQDPKYDTIFGRFAVQDELQALYRELVRNRTMTELCSEGQARGIPIAPLLRTDEVMEEEHFKARGAFIRGEIAQGVEARMPSGFVEVDGTRVGFRHRAPEVGEHNKDLLGVRRETAPGAEVREAVRDAKPRLPLEGVRILDFGVAIYGAEVGRNLADMGAEVIKIESKAFPDVTRIAANDPTPVPANFAIGHRNQKGFGLNLRTPQAVEVLKQLVAHSDVVLSNFKPGTLERLGVSYEVLAAVNPRLVWLSGSGMGHTGPWAHWLGYGPLVRCSSGLTNLWRYPDDPVSFSDPVTIYPDYYAARVACLAVVAGLIRAKRTGRGADIRLSHCESVINMLAEEFVKEDLEPGSSQPRGNLSDLGGPWNVYKCAGDDEWCVITVRDDDDWERFVEAIGSPAWAKSDRFSGSSDRVVRRSEIDGLVTEWTSERPPNEVMEILQAAHVPAGRMLRHADLMDDPQLKARNFIAWLEQPGLPSPLPMEARPFHAKHIPSPPLRPAPLIGEHTGEIVCPAGPAEAGQRSDRASHCRRRPRRDGDDRGLKRPYSWRCCRAFCRLRRGQRADVTIVVAGGPATGALVWSPPCQGGADGNGDDWRDPPHHGRGGTRAELARMVEARGFDSFFLCEHTCIPVDSVGSGPRGIVPPWTKRMPDPYVSLAAVAATTGLEIGTAVSLPAEHEPIAQAKAVATLDQLSEGRFIFGVGWGWNREEFAACTGRPAKQRVPILREKLDAMRRLWQDDEAEYHGEHVDVPATWSWPKPARPGGPPILLGTPGNERNFRRIIEWADGWIPMSSGIDDTIYSQIVQLRRMWTEAGRDLESLDVTVIWGAAEGRDEMRRVLERANELDVRRILVQVWTEDMPRFEQLIDAAAVPVNER